MNKPAFARRALADLDEVLYYIARDKPRTASSFVETIIAKCELLADHPDVGESREDLSPGLRAFSFRSYVIFFRRESNTVRIERVLHGARDIGSLLWP